MDAGAFKTACYEAARRLSGRVRATRAAGPAANFHTVDLALAGQQLTVLCNAHFSLIGFAEPISPGQQVFDFVDVPPLAEALKSQGRFEVLTATELDSPVTQESLSLLSPAELQQVQYWKPRTIGQVVFNCWD